LKRILTLLFIVMAAAVNWITAQDLDRSVEFHFGDRAIVVPRFGPKVELLPVLELVGADARFSLSAGTYGVVLGEHVIQFSVGHKVMLVNGNLQDAQEAPVASPGGVAASFSFLERSLLSPLGFRLEPIPLGYRIEQGARFADPVSVRPAVADFGVTTTLVLTLSRSTPAEVADAETGKISVRFDEATPQLDGSTPFRSRRVLSLTSREQAIEISLAPGVGLLQDSGAEVRASDVLNHEPVYFIALCAAEERYLPAVVNGLSLFDDAGESVYRHYHHEIRKNMAAGEILAARDHELAQLRAAMKTAPSGQPRPSWWRRLLGGR